MTADNRLFYYPYATFFDAQLPLLKVAALYFDKLALLDPRSASWDRIGADPKALTEVSLLEQHGLLDRVHPSEVLERYEEPFTDAVREDLRDPEFMGLCNEHAQRAGKHVWSLALEKIPQNLLADSR